MEATVSYLLIIQKCINSKQNTLKWNIIHCVYVIFQNISQLKKRKKKKKKTGLKGTGKVFLSIKMLLVLIRF